MPVQYIHQRRNRRVSRIVPRHLREFIAQGQAQLKFQIIAHSVVVLLQASIAASSCGALLRTSRFYRGGRQIQGPEELWRRTWAKTLSSLP